MNYTVKLISGPFVAMLSEGPKALSLIAMPRNDASYRCTFIPHILEQIAVELRGGPCGRKSLLSMVRVCKTFYHIAVAVLWSETVGMRPFMCTIPGYVWETDEEGVLRWKCEVSRLLDLPIAAEDRLTHPCQDSWRGLLTPSRLRYQSPGPTRTTRQDVHMGLWPRGTRQARYGRFSRRHSWVNDTICASNLSAHREQTQRE